MIAALFVETGGVYFGLPDVDPWDAVRDARLYPGPHPVVAHPPCERWGRYWSGGPSALGRFRLGEDGGCFAAALLAVRTWGGVLEHPEASHAWRAYGINPPGYDVGWIPAGDGLGWTCRVEQGHYGHPARKATWLYAVGCELPQLARGRSTAIGAVDHGAARSRRRVERGQVSALSMPGVHVPRRLPDRWRSETPSAFRDTLIAMARSRSAERMRSPLPQVELFG